jgi:hypothetical protein
MATYADMIGRELHELAVSYGVVSDFDTANDCEMFAADARAEDGRRWIVRAESHLGALMEWKTMIVQEANALQRVEVSDW